MVSWRPIGSPTWAFQEPIVGPLKFKMAKIRHIENRFLAITQHPIALFQWNFAWGNSFPPQISAMGQRSVYHRTYFLFSLCTLGFGERRLSYRLRYNCYWKNGQNLAEPYSKVVRQLHAMLPVPTVSFMNRTEPAIASYVGGIMLCVRFVLGSLVSWEISIMLVCAADYRSS